MNFSEPFIRRPVATSLLAAGILAGGILAACFLPIAPLPNVRHPDPLGQKSYEEEIN